MSRRNSDPYDIDLQGDAYDEFRIWLCDEVQAALDARSSLVGDDALLDYAHELYEQGNSKITKNDPWPGCANLTSYIGTEKVDALRARAVKTIFTEPVFVVEGIGDSAPKAAFVEEFHQYAIEKIERLQSRVARALHNAFVEGVGVLYTCEATDYIRKTGEKQIRPQMNADGGLVLDEKFLPQPERDPQTGDFVPAAEGEPAMTAVVDWRELVSKGPTTRVLSLKDFVQLPGHASDKADVWGYGHRFYRRLRDLEQKQKQGIYKNVELLGNAPDRQSKPRELAQGQDVAPQKGASIEKELWEVYVKYDFDGRGDRWHLVTLSLPHRVILRLKVDDLNMVRYNLLIPSPMPNSVWGYSQILHKLGTIIEEHTAERNMIADRSAMVTNAPIKQLQGALWDSASEPWGPGQIIPVRSMEEIAPVQMPDVPQSMFLQLQHTEQASERIVGVNDIAAVGVQSGTARTLGENQMAAAASAVRMDEAIKNIQEGLEPLAELRHELWKRALRSNQQGLELPNSVTQALEMRGAQIEGNRATADLLEGNYQFKPRGSVESADPNKRKQDTANLLDAIGKLTAGIPMVGAWMSRPPSVRVLLGELLRAFNAPERQKLLGTQQEWEQFVQQQQMQQQMAAQQAQMQQAMGGTPGPAAGQAPRPAPSTPNGLPPQIHALLQQAMPRGPMPS